MKGHEFQVNLSPTGIAAEEIKGIFPFRILIFFSQFTGQESHSHF